MIKMNFQEAGMSYSCLLQEMIYMQSKHEEFSVDFW